MNTEPKTNRSKEALVADMLSVAASSPVKKTLIMYKAALSYAQLQKYMQYLQDKGLIVRRDEGDWAITEKGKAYLKVYRTMQQTLGLGPEDQEEIPPLATNIR